MKKRIDKVDRISALPESLIHHIMTFLSLKEVVLASMLCKTWNEAWFTFPNLEFCHDSRSSDSTRKEILKCLENILLRRHMELISIRKVTLHFLSSDQEIERLIDRCLCHVFGSNVKELNLEGYCYRMYRVPQIIFSAQSLNVLELRFCKLFRPRIIVKLFLRKLCLSHVSADDHTIQNLIAGCPLIEYLLIDYCTGFRSLELFNLGKLKYIKVKDNHDLRQLNINELNVHSVTIRLIFVGEINIASCMNVKRLELSHLFSIMDDWLCNAISKLLFLEDLSISDCWRLQHIKISGPCLKALSIKRCTLVDVKIETPNLSVFDYNGNLISFSSTGKALSTYLCIDYEIADAKYIEFLAKFQGFTEMLDLRYAGDENNELAIIPRELRQNLHPPLSSVRRLNFSVDECFNEFSITELVDGLLWISPHVETASLKCRCHYRNKFSFQFTYKKKLNYEGETFHCCRSLPVSCWQNCIEKVEIKHWSRETIVGAKSYSFQGEKILEEIDGLYTNLVEQDLLCL